METIISVGMKTIYMLIIIRPELLSVPILKLGPGVPMNFDLKNCAVSPFIGKYMAGIKYVPLFSLILYFASEHRIAHDWKRNSFADMCVCVHLFT